MTSSISKPMAGFDPQQFAQRMQAKFEKVDTDGSGSVNKQEMFAAAEAAGRDISKMEARFDRMDSDGDGELTLEEQRAMMEERRAQMGRSDQPYGVPGGQQGMLMNMIKKVAQNTDNASLSSSLNDLLERLESDEEQEAESALDEAFALIDEEGPAVRTLS